MLACPVFARARCAAFAILLLTSGGVRADVPLRALLVGGGPDTKHNQVAIESNVRYVHKLLPSNASARVLFADGDPKTADVLYQSEKGRERLRPANLPAINGPSQASAVAAEFRRLQSASTPLLLYFTGHGSPNPGGDFNNNDYDLWGGGRLSVRELAAQMKTLPQGTPVALVMVQCFSGAFANLLFEDGDPANPAVSRDFCGFFASRPERTAAGCTSEVNEAEYHDFTSYFFAALSGVDRVGRRVSGADYDKNGTVGMDEAFAYTLIHDASIDTPVCTSDVFLRHVVKTTDDEAMQTPYSQVTAWANPSQRAALEQLSAQTGLRGDGRLGAALTEFRRRVRSGNRAERDEVSDAGWIRFVRVAKTVVLAHQLAQTGAESDKKRYAAIIAAEARNPLRPGR